MNFDEIPGSIYISIDKGNLDRDWVRRSIQGSYWGGWRTRENIDRAIENSMCWGLFMRVAFDPNSTVPVKDKQIGFARIVTDDATHAWLCDVIIDAAHRRKGFGTGFILHVLRHPRVRIRPVMLATRDAHRFYSKFGFGGVDAMSRAPEVKDHP